MSDESQLSPLAAGIQRKSDEQFSTEDPEFLRHRSHHHHHQKSNKLIVYVLSVVVITATILLTLASIFLHVNLPSARLTSASVTNLLLTTNNNSSLNMTFFGRINLDNDNFGRFNYDGFQTGMFFGNLTIGRGDVGGGRVRARGESTVDVRVEVRAENLTSSDSNINNDVMELVSYGEVRGRVRIMRLVNRFQMVRLNCSMSLHLTNQGITNLRCRS